MNYVDFGRRVKHLRQEQHITQEVLAEKADVSASFLGHIERGTRVASLETMVKLCHALSTSPNHLLAFTLNDEWLPLPDHMTAEKRKELAELLYQGFHILNTKTP